MSERSMYRYAFGIGLAASMAAVPISTEVASAQPPSPQSESGASPTCDSPSGENTLGFKPASKDIELLAQEIRHLKGIKSTSSEADEQYYDFNRTFENGSISVSTTYTSLGYTCVKGHAEPVYLSKPQLSGVFLNVNEPENRVNYEELSFIPSYGDSSNTNSKGNSYIWSATAQYLTKKSSDGFGNTPRGTVIGRVFAEGDNGKSTTDNAPLEVTIHGLLPVTKVGNKSSYNEAVKILDLIEGQASTVMHSVKDSKDLPKNAEISLNS